ncbi:hypothetical protein SAMN02745134_01987 [Clostridium acidisoli DSM 12555]|uniref:Uncharacterized protein n=1 Tax=Clostridium acidisoli DSM 12555 TaxID=1121291 RepID=A0A1W1XJS6_9CLOT|nr:hypothetical protein [Clostridium acidisoli]SMC23791.1 hypothetical protein SAMN02745134_01987 [Clostridium acidisoli DSM 12555]
MSNRKVLENYYSDINNQVELLGKLTNSYRLLIGGAGELNGIALATKNDVRNAIKRVNKLGQVIDNILCEMNEHDKAYIKYCKLKDELMRELVDKVYISDEIEEEFKKTP